MKKITFLIAIAITIISCNLVFAQDWCKGGWWTVKDTDTSHDSSWSGTFYFKSNGYWDSTKTWGGSKINSSTETKPEQVNMPDTSHSKGTIPSSATEKNTKETAQEGTWAGDNENGWYFVYTGTSGASYCGKDKGAGWYYIKGKDSTGVEHIFCSYFDDEGWCIIDTSKTDGDGYRTEGGITKDYASAGTGGTNVLQFTPKKYNIAVVGNSLGANFSYYNKIDNDLGIAWVGNHSVGGDGLASYGLPSDAEYEHYDMATGKMIDKVKLPKGYGAGWIRDWVNQSNNYEFAILFFGSNELSRTAGQKDKVVNQYKTYLQAIRNMGDKCKVLVMGIPHQDTENGSQWEDSFIDDWNKSIEQMVKNDFGDNKKIYYMAMDVTKSDFKDRVHFTRAYNQSLWNKIKTKYNLTVNVG